MCKPSYIGFDKMLGTRDGDEVQWVKLLLILHTHDTYKLTQALTPKHEKKNDLENHFSRVEVVHAFNPRSQKAEAGRCL